MFHVWYVQAILIFIIVLFIFGIHKFIYKKKVFTKKRRWLKWFDIECIVIFIGLHFMSEEILGTSCIPFFVCGLSFFGFLMTLLYWHEEGQIIYKRFLRQYWSFSNMAIILGYFVFIIIGTIKTVM